MAKLTGLALSFAGARVPGAALGRPAAGSGDGVRCFGSPRVLVEPDPAAGKRARGRRSGPARGSLPLSALQPRGAGRAQSQGSALCSDSCSRLPGASAWSKAEVKPGREDHFFWIQSLRVISLGGLSAVFPQFLERACAQAGGGGHGV